MNISEWQTLANLAIVALKFISRSFQVPDHTSIFAFLMGCASKFAAKNNPLNFVPPLHEFIWLSDACIQIQWLSPTLSSPSFLAWRCAALLEKRIAHSFHTFSVIFHLSFDGDTQQFSRCSWPSGNIWESTSWCRWAKVTWVVKSVGPVDPFLYLIP